MCWAVHLGRDCDQPEKEQAMTDAMTDVSHTEHDLIKRMHCLALELPEPIWRDACLPVIDYLQRRRASDDAKDAARYRWLRDGCTEIDDGPVYASDVAVSIASDKDGSEWDAAIDRAMGAEHG
jgi:hypothetical protein